MDLIVKTSDEPESIVAAIKREVQALDPEQPLGNVRTLESLLAQSIAPRRDVARQKYNDHEDHRHRDKHFRIERSDSVEQA